MADKATVEFIDLYNRLETVIRGMYDVPEETGAVAWLVRNERGFQRYRDELNYCREVRNLLQHNERLAGDYAVIPSQAMLESLRSTLAKVEGMPKSRDLCVKVRDIYSVHMDSCIVPALREMRSKSYTHIPILSEGRVIGAFSENTLLSYLIDNEIIGFSEDDTFAMVGDLLPLDKHESEVFAFVSSDMLATDIAELFQEHLRRSERLGMIFVTAHGRSSERLLGVITSWDMAAYF